MRSLGLAIVVGMAAAGMVAGCGLMLDYSEYETVPAGSGGSGNATTTSAGGGTAGAGAQAGSGGTTGSGGDAGSGAVAGGGGSVTGGGGAGGSGGSGGSGGGPCLGCIDPDTQECRGGDQVFACGQPGTTCSDCRDADPCTLDECNATLQCANSTIADTLPCAAPLENQGVCVGGFCVQEICNDGDDNNGDGNADCADSYCVDQGWTCVPPAPSGWFGPVMLAYDANPEFPTLECTGTEGWGVDSAAAYSGLVAPNATCAACTCEAPTWNCPAARLDIMAHLPDPIDCTDANACTENFSVPSNGACQALSVNCGGNPLATRAVNAGVGDATCAASGGQATILSAAWQRHFVACASELPLSTCQPSGLCVPPKPGGTPWANAHCIWSDDLTEPCPMGPYSNTVVVAHTTDEFTDDRDCSACGCQPIFNEPCHGTLKLFAGGACNQMPLRTYDLTTAILGCDGLGAAASPLSATYVPNPSKGCSPTVGGGQPVGAALPTGPAIKLCCDASLP